MDPGLEKLEFHRILEHVSALAGSPPGKKLVMSLQPAFDREAADTSDGKRSMEPGCWSSP